MREKVLVMPRRLAIRILHEAQIAQPEPIHGWVAGKNGEPSGFHLSNDTEAREAVAASAWARLWSRPNEPAVPEIEEMQPGVLHLLVSLNIKGVLEMRAWELRGTQLHERVLQVAD